MYNFIFSDLLTIFALLHDFVKAPTTIYSKKEYDHAGKINPTKKVL